MAYTFKNARLVVTTSMQTLYACPSATTAIVLACSVANVDGVNSADATVQWRDSSAASAATRLAYVIPVPAKSTLRPVTGDSKLVLEASDDIQVQASANSDLEATAVVLEIT